MAKIRRDDLHPGTTQINLSAVETAQAAAAHRTLRQPGGTPRPAPPPLPDGTAVAPSPQAAAAAPGRDRSGRLYTAAMVFFAVVFAVSAGMLLKRFWDDRRTESKFASLAALIDTSAPAPAAEQTGGEGAEEPSNAAKFAALKAQNGDFAGWISIEGTNLDLPVMQTFGERADFYLRHDFDGAYSVYGVPYLDENCTLSNGGTSNNLVIYGHNMKTGTIFGCLTGYKQASYYQEHPFIRFDNLYFDGTYEVFAAFAIDVEQDTSFVYNTYLDMQQEAFDAYVAEVVARSDVDTGIVPAYGEDLLTLSTCEYSTGNGRYVVVARRVFP